MHRRARLPRVAAILGVSAALAAAPCAHAAPACRYSATPDIVLDNDTGLTWQAVVDAATTMSFTDAEAYCASLPLEGGGWRMPRIQELFSLIDEGVYDPAIDGGVFPDTPSELFWTSTSNPDGQPLAVNFEFGTTRNAADVDLLYVRCVR
jgi:hypothetical protein